MERNGSTSCAGKTRRGRYLHNHPGDDRVVIVDLDGVLADLSEFEELLTLDDVPIAQRWQNFFAHIPDATVLDEGRDLVWAIDGLGYTVVYSTTRPAYTRTPSRIWLKDSEFPTCRALLTRPHLETAGHPQPALQIKLAHARAVTNKHPAWLRCFVDDDHTVVEQLRGHHVPASIACELSALGVAALRRRLDSGPAKTLEPPVSAIALHLP